MLSFIEGHTVAELDEIGNEVYEESIASRIWPGTRAIAQMHLDVGQQVWLVTAAPVEVAGIIAARLGLTGALGTTAEHDGRRLHRSAARRAAARSGQGRGRPGLAREHGLDLARCFAYSDSYNDLPMLSLVGHPCAINPDGRLLAHAEEHDWQIRDYRTGRKAARLGLLGAGAAGATAGAVATGLAVRRYLAALTVIGSTGVSRRERRGDDVGDHCGRCEVEAVAEEPEHRDGLGPPVVRLRPGRARSQRRRAAPARPRPRRRSP